MIEFIDILVKFFTNVTPLTFYYYLILWGGIGFLVLMFILIAKELKTPKEKKERGEEETEIKPNLLLWIKIIGRGVTHNEIIPFSNPTHTYTFKKMKYTVDPEYLLNWKVNLLIKLKDWVQGYKRRYMIIFKESTQEPIKIPSLIDEKGNLKPRVTAWNLFVIRRSRALSKALQSIGLDFDIGKIIFIVVVVVVLMYLAMYFGVIRI